MNIIMWLWGKGGWHLSPQVYPGLFTEYLLLRLVYIYNNYRCNQEKMINEIFFSF